MWLTPSVPRQALRLRHAALGLPTALQTWKYITKTRIRQVRMMQVPFGALINTLCIQYMSVHADNTR